MAMSRILVLIRMMRMMRMIPLLMFCVDRCEIEIFGLGWDRGLEFDGYD